MKTFWKEFFWTFVMISIAFALGASTCKAQEYKPVDVALLLAVDVSGSVGDATWELQKQGLAKAIASQRFEMVIKTNWIGRVAIGIMQWDNMGSVVIPMRVLENGWDAAKLALDILDMKRMGSGNTFVGNMFKDAYPVLQPWANYATRLVIDVSGDGESNGGVDVAPMRQRLLDMDVTINALPVVTDFAPKLDDWYADNVMGGPGAFLVVANGFEDFHRAFLRKFIYELALNR